MGYTVPTDFQIGLAFLKQNRDAIRQDILKRCASITERFVVEKTLDIIETTYDESTNGSHAAP